MGVLGVRHPGRHSRTPGARIKGSLEYDLCTSEGDSDNGEQQWGKKSDYSRAKSEEAGRM